MSRKIEDKAIEYLIQFYKNPKFKFEKKEKTDKGFDIWLIDIILQKKIKIELKATNCSYKTNNNIFNQLYFSADNEIENFISGETQILRVFLGDNPPKLKLMDNSILSSGAEFVPEARWKIKGKKHYNKIIDIS